MSAPAAYRAGVPLPTGVPSLIFPTLEHCLLWSQQVDAELPGLRRRLVWTRTPTGERAVLLACQDGSHLADDGSDVLCAVARQHGLHPSAWPPPTVELPPALLRWHALVHGDPGPGERIETRAFAPGQPPVQVFSPTIADAARAELRYSATHNTYCGMALRGPVLDGSADNCVAVRCLWAEVDLKHVGPDRAALLRYLVTFPLRLPVIIFSGGGCHIQVPLAASLDLAEPGAKERVEQVNRHLAVALGKGVQLDHVGDIPRILRPPCTRNYKYSPAPHVEGVRLDGACRYRLDELQAWLAEHCPLPPEPEPPRRNGHKTRHDDGLVTPWDDWSQQVTWHELLIRDGFTYAYTRGEKERWTRPGKSVRAGISVDVHHGLDVLYCFSSSIPGLEMNKGYNRWSYEVALRHGGDFQAAARAKAEEGYGTVGAYAKEHGCSLAEAARALAQARDGTSAITTIDLTTGARTTQRRGLYCRRNVGGSAELPIMRGDYGHLETI